MTINAQWVEMLERRLADCDYAERGTIQCGHAGSANVVRYNGEDVVGCAHVYDDRDRLFLGLLAEGAPDIIAILKQHFKSGTNDAERRLRRFAEIVNMAEGFDERFGSETAADHELSAIREDFMAARKEGLDCYAALCRALDVGQPHKPDSANPAPSVQVTGPRARGDDDRPEGSGPSAGCGVFVYGGESHECPSAGTENG